MIRGMGRASAQRAWSWMRSRDASAWLVLLATSLDGLVLLTRPSRGVAFIELGVLGALSLALVVALAPQHRALPMPSSNASATQRLWLARTGRRAAPWGVAAVLFTLERNARHEPPSVCFWLPHGLAVVALLTALDGRTTERAATRAALVALAASLALDAHGALFEEFGRTTWLAMVGTLAALVVLRRVLAARGRRRGALAAHLPVVGLAGVTLGRAVTSRLEALAVGVVWEGMGDPFEGHPPNALGGELGPPTVPTAVVEATIERLAGWANLIGGATLTLGALLFVLVFAAAWSGVRRRSAVRLGATGLVPLTLVALLTTTQALATNPRWLSTPPSRAALWTALDAPFAPLVVESSPTVERVLSVARVVLAADGSFVVEDEDHHITRHPGDAPVRHAATHVVVLPDRYTRLRQLQAVTEAFPSIDRLDIVALNHPLDAAPTPRARWRFTDAPLRSHTRVMSFHILRSSPLATVRRSFEFDVADMRTDGDLALVDILEDPTRLPASTIDDVHRPALIAPRLGTLGTPATSTEVLPFDAGLRSTEPPLTWLALATIALAALALVVLVAGRDGPIATRLTRLLDLAPRATVVSAAGPFRTDGRDAPRATVLSPRARLGAIARRFALELAVSALVVGPPLALAFVPR